MLSLLYLAIALLLLLLSVGCFKEIPIADRLLRAFRIKPPTNTTQGFFSKLKVKLFGIAGLLVTFAMVVYLVTERIPNEIRALPHGISADEYADLKLYFGDGPLDAVIGSYKDYKSRGIKSVYDFREASRMNETDPATYYQRRQESFRVEMDAKKQAEQLKKATERGFQSVEDMNAHDEQKRIEAEAKKKLLNETEQRAAEYQNRRQDPMCKKFYAAHPKCVAAFNYQACLERQDVSFIAQSYCPNPNN